MPDYVSVSALDLIPLRTAQLQTAATHIDGALTKGPVYVCCALGYSRSAAAVAAWLIASGRAAELNDALTTIRAVRPQTVLSDEQCRALDYLASRHKEAR